MTAAAASRRHGVALLRVPIRAWQVLSAVLPPRCRYFPSCSQYALDALELHGAARGSWLAARRLGRCHPWHEGGLDPVPRPNTRSLPGRLPRPAQQEES